METEHTNPTNDDKIRVDETNPQNATASLPPIPPRSPEVDQPPMEFPPIGYDPARIPTSIFSSGPTNPAEWSCTSNESLFSIHMGNNSFSRDYAILFGNSGEIRDWNELPRLDEWSPNNNKPSDTVIVSSPSPSPSHQEINSTMEKREKEDEVNGHEEEKPLVINSPTEVKKASPEKRVVPATNHPPAYQSPPEKGVVPATNHPPAYQSPPEKRVVPAPNHPPAYQSPPEKRVVPAPNHLPSYQSPPRFSNDSGNSCKSFAFPVLVSESRKPESVKIVQKPPEPQDPKENPRKKRCFSFHICCCCCWPRCC